VIHAPDQIEAEKEDQRKLKPNLEDIITFVQRPLIMPPLSEDRSKRLLETFKAGIEQQAMASGVVDVTAMELPLDLEVLFSTVGGIYAAEVPSEIVYSQLIYAFQPGTNAQDMIPHRLSLIREDLKHPGDEVPIAALHLGGCGQHRAIYYVLSQMSSSKEISPAARWQIWDVRHYQIEHFQDLQDFLMQETEEIESEGPPVREIVVLHNRYPL
jgi:hypothetical protein